MFLNIKTTKDEEAVDITDNLKKSLYTLLTSKEYSGLKKGFLTVYNPHTTCALLINEGADKNLIEDIFNTIDRLIPKHNKYKHDLIDNNAHAHIKASLFSTSLVIPFEGKELLLGTWQHVFLLEFDGPRTRKLYIAMR